MKSLVRSWATLSLVAATSLGSVLVSGLGALALPEAQIMEKLRTVPVFTIADRDGSPLVASVEQQRVSGVFISQTDAEAFVNKLKRENPDLGNQVRVFPVSLGEIYQLNQSRENQNNGLGFAFLPMQNQVQSAVSVLRQQGQNIENFQGVPLFVARGGSDRGYLTIQRDGEQVIPFFFEKEQLQTVIDRFKQQQPSLAGTVQVQVVPLEGVIRTLQTSNDAQLNKIVLVPSRESLQFLQSLPQGQN
ncbi:MAG: Tic22 family protein [Oscillatoria sp. PMC 1068.18]|nr:Tic22 family protein [Oscillatoria sp. PMC 1076.18]MEC4989200.1 Tic22 family protein [Oscillatoria sp. PMC 1068.18]